MSDDTQNIEGLTISYKNDPNTYELECFIDGEKIVTFDYGDEDNIPSYQGDFEEIIKATCKSVQAMIARPDFEDGPEFEGWEKRAGLGNLKHMRPTHPDALNLGAQERRYMIAPENLFCRIEYHEKAGQILVEKIYDDKEDRPGVSFKMKSGAIVMTLTVLSKTEEIQDKFFRKTTGDDLVEFITSKLGEHLFT